uniref:Shieldin complex subunit 2 n=1 Tax=Latimeria chalumnae TaxID=7897 RepID=M3XLG8_LATCH
MTNRSKVHIFLGAPVISTQKGHKSKGEKESSSENWRKLHLLYPEGCINTDAGHQAFEHRVYKEQIAGQTEGSCAKNLKPNNTSISEDLVAFHNFEVQCREALSSTQVAPAESFDQNYKENDKAINRCVEERIFKLGEGSCKTEAVQLSGQCNEDYQGDAIVQDNRHCTDIYDSGSSTKLETTEQKNWITNYWDVLHVSLMEYLENSFLSKTQLPVPKNSSTERASQELSTETEFLSILTASQAAVLMQRTLQEQLGVHGQPETEKGANSEKINERTFSQPLECTSVSGKHHSPVDMCPDKDTHECKSSPELFSGITFGTPIKIDDQGNTSESSQELFSPIIEQFESQVHMEACSEGLLCSQVSVSIKGSIKRPKMSEDTHESPPVQESSSFAVIESPAAKKSKMAHSCPKVNTTGVSNLKGQPIKTVLLRNCFNNNVKYHVLTSVVHLCHLKEIQIKSGPMAGAKVPLATIVVIDQSGIEMKVVLWRAAAFWSLTVFPGDIVLITDVTLYKDRWQGEEVLQSTAASRLLNLGPCTTVQPQECFNLVDVAVLLDLLLFISHERSDLTTIPPRHPQSLGGIQHVRLDQLQPNVLVHAFLKIISITVLTETLYTYKREKQQKVVVAVKQVKGQQATLVLWGAKTAWHPQIQRRKSKYNSFFLFAILG